MTPVTLYRWISGKFDPSLPKLAELAEAMDVSLAWLVTGTGPVNARRARRHALLEEYETTEYERAGKPPLAFYDPWLFELVYGPASEPTSGSTDMKTPLLMEVGDDSMEPTITKGDLVLLDRTCGVRPTAQQQNEGEWKPIFDGIYAVRAGSLAAKASDRSGPLVVRRIHYQLNGIMVVRCDSSSYPEESYSLKHDRPVPVGRVVWRGTKM